MTRALIIVPDAHQGTMTPSALSTPSSTSTSAPSAAPRVLRTKRVIQVHQVRSSYIKIAKYSNRYTECTRYTEAPQAGTLSDASHSKISHRELQQENQVLRRVLQVHRALEPSTPRAPGTTSTLTSALLFTKWFASADKCFRECATRSPQ